MPDIFDEVNEDLRAEKASRLAQKYGALGVLVLLLVLAGTGGYVWWQQQQVKQADAAATLLIAAQKAADVHAPLKPPASALQDFAKVAATGPDSYRVLEWDAGKTAQAVTDWAAVANDASAPPLLRDLATLASVQHRLDTGDAATLKAELQPLLLGTSAWKPMAEQVMAMLELKLGNTKAARAIVKSLVADPQAPEGVRQMAEDLMVALGDDPATPPAAGSKPAGSKG